MGKMRTMNCQPLADLIRKAKGDRSLKQYGLDCGISVSNLSKMMNNKMPYLPGPRTIAKLTLGDAKPQNGVTYTDMMLAAGFQLPQSEGGITVDAALDEASNGEGQAMFSRMMSYYENIKRYDISPEQTRLEKLAKGIILGHIATREISFSYEDSEAPSEFIPDLRLKLDNSEFDSWWIEVKSYGSSEMSVFQVLGIAASVPSDKKRKFSIAIDSENLFNKLMELKDKTCMNANVSIILVDVEKAEIAKEEYIAKWKKTAK